MIFIPFLTIVWVRKIVACLVAEIPIIRILGARPL